MSEYVAFDINCHLGEFVGIVKVDPEMSEADARRDAFKLASSAFFQSYGEVRVSKAGRNLRKVPESAWEAEECKGWGWIMRGGLGQSDES